LRIMVEVSPKTVANSGRMSRSSALPVKEQALP
jgi:hypothetical protein